MIHVAPEHLADCFVEFRDYLGRCKFNDCKHLTEPGCAISAAAALGAIDPGRVESYRKLVMQLMKKAQRWD